MSDRKKVTVAMLIATFLSAIEVTVVSTAIPRIASDLGGDSIYQLGICRLFAGIDGDHSDLREACGSVRA